MDWIAQLTLFMGILTALLVGGMWVPFAIGASAIVAIFVTDGLFGFRAIGIVTWGTLNSFTLTAIPLFILMAEILQVSGVGGRFYRGLALIVRGMPGGLLQTNILGSALFAAISGSSVATAAAVATVAVPELDRDGYRPTLSAGTLAAGGALGILIPPSIPLIIYGAFTDTSVAKLFLAGMIPGAILTSFFLIYVAVMAMLGKIRVRESIQTGSLLEAWKNVIPLIVLITMVLGSIYAGIATPTEAAGLGCAVAIVIASIWGNLNAKLLRGALQSAIATSATLLSIVMMAFLFSYAVENAGLSTMLTRSITEMGLGKYGFLLAVVLLFCILGCIMESIAMIVLTIPLLFGTVLSFGIDPVWFGIFMVLLLELGMLTPPFGINLFVIQGASGYEMRTILKGVIPYWFIILGFILLITIYPGIVTWILPV